MRAMILAAALIAAIQAGPARACLLHMSTDGFSIAHPGTLSVSLALRDAIAEGIVEPLPENANARLGTLMMMSWKARAHVNAVAASGADGPPISVLLTQSGVWIRLNDPDRGAVFHSEPPLADEAVILLPDTAFLELIDGVVTLDELSRLGLARAYSHEPEASLEAFETAVTKAGRPELN